MVNIAEAAEACMRMGYRRGVYNIHTDRMEWCRENGAYAIIHDEHGENCHIEFINQRGESSMAKDSTPAPASGGGYNPQERAAIDKEIAQVNKDTGASDRGGKTDGDYGEAGGSGDTVGDNPFNH